LYDEDGNVAAIVNELVSFVKLIVLFENVYKIVDPDDGLRYSDDSETTEENITEDNETTSGNEDSDEINDDGLQQ